MKSTSNAQSRGGEPLTTVTSSDSWHTDPTKGAVDVRQGPAVTDHTLPATRRTQPKQGEEEANVHLLQTVWCRYVGQTFSQPTNIWSAVLSQLGASQASNQQQPARMQQQHSLPHSSARLNHQHSAPLIPKDLVQAQLYALQSDSHQDATIKPRDQSLQSRADRLQDGHPYHKTVKHELQDGYGHQATAQHELQDGYGHQATAQHELQDGHPYQRTAQQELQDGHHYPKTAQEELAELLSANHDAITAAEHRRPPHGHPQQFEAALHGVPQEWALACAQAGNQDIGLHGMPPRSMPARSFLSHPPSPTPEVSRSLSWSQPAKADHDHLLVPEQQLQQPSSSPHQRQQQRPGFLHQQQHQQQASQPKLAMDHAGSAESPYPGSAYQEPVWNLEGLTDLNQAHGNSHQHDGYAPKQADLGRSFGMGQYAVEAAAVPSFQPSLDSQHQQHQQHEVPQWHQPMLQQDSARAVRPRQNYSCPGHAHRPSFLASASHPAREDSGDLSTSAGTQHFLGRVYSAGPAFSGSHAVHDALRPVAVASPKSSLGSSLPSLASSLNQVARSNNLQLGRSHSNSGRQELGSLGPEGQQGSGRGPPIPAKLLMQLVAAPSMFSVPLCTGKVLNPPFRVRVAMLSETPTKLPLTLKAYVLSKDNLSSLQQWHPDQHIVTEAVSGGEVKQTLWCNESSVRGGQGIGVGVDNREGQGDGAGLLGGVTDFVFRDLKFTISSRMKPRWLVIAAVLPTKDVMYLQYNVPTIIMSRACDQFSKALEILKGVELGTAAGSGARKRGRSPVKGPFPKVEELEHVSAVIVNGTSGASFEERDDVLDWPTSGPFTFQRWHVLIERKYNAFNLARPLEVADLRMMERVAGFYDLDRGSPADSLLTPHQWAYFGMWYLSYLRIFRCHQQLWAQQSPTAICGFAVDRPTAEQLLAGQPVGTFLVRPGLRLAGCLVVSAVVQGGHCRHMALDSTQLDSRSLEVWVRDILEAQQVLDHKTGHRYSKSEVFLLHAQRFGVMSDVQHQAVVREQ